MSTRVIAEKERSSESIDGKQRGGKGLPSLKIVAGCFMVVALVLALGMTGGQVRELAGRVTAIEGERDAFELRVDKLRADNQQLIERLRDYQGVLDVAQAANISLSKRLRNRDMAVDDLQNSLDSILKEKYATENTLRAEIGRLENLKRDLSAQVAALGEAVAAQSNEIANLDSAYREAERGLAQSGERNAQLLAENDRYLDLLTEMQDDLDAVQQEGEVMAERFATLQSESEELELEKIAIQQELELIKTLNVSPFGVEGATPDPFDDQDPFGVGAEASDDAENVRGESEIVATAEHPA